MIFILIVLKSLYTELFFIVGITNLKAYFSKIFSWWKFEKKQYEMKLFVFIYLLFRHLAKVTHMSHMLYVKT